MQIERAQMRLRLVVPSREAKRVHEKLVPNISVIESEDWQGGELEMVSVLHTSNYWQLFAEVEVNSGGYLHSCKEAR